MVNKDMNTVKLNNLYILIRPNILTEIPWYVKIRYATRAKMNVAASQAKMPMISSIKCDIQFAR